MLRGANKELSKKQSVGLATVVKNLAAWPLTNFAGSWKHKSGNIKSNILDELYQILYTVYDTVVYNLEATKFSSPQQCVGPRRAGVGLAGLTTI
eukprot:SAG31_NODE_7185_length_1762_cov_2.084185_2_plen_94_part_00